MWDRLGTDHKLVIAYGLFSFTSNKLLGANYFFIVFFRASSQLTLPRPSPLARLGIATKMLKNHKDRAERLNPLFPKTIGWHLYSRFHPAS